MSTYLGRLVLIGIPAAALLACGGQAGSSPPADGGSGSSSGGSGSSSGGSGGDAGDAGVPSEAFVAATIGSTPALTGLCPFARLIDWGDLGMATTPPTTVSNGQDQSGTPATVRCGVAADGAGFDVEMNASLSGAGSIRIASNTPGGVTLASGASGVTGTFQSGKYGRYTSDHCTIAYTFNNAPVPVSPPIAPGRIWGHLSCPDAVTADILVMTPDGGTVNATCDAEADFFFENCTR
jgi:hypothetical protein